jgi:hypothetical protein
MIDKLALENDLGLYGNVVYCDYNNSENSSFVVVLSNVTTDQLTLDNITSFYINIEFLNNVPSTFEYGVYKIQYDNFPNN